MRLCVIVFSSKDPSWKAQSFTILTIISFLPKYWTYFSEPRAEGVSRGICKKGNDKQNGLLKKEANLDSTYRNIFK